MPYLTVVLVFAMGLAVVVGVAVVVLKALDRLQTPRPDHCSFCGKHTREVGRLVPAPGLYVCNACIQSFADSTLDTGTPAQGIPTKDTEPGLHATPCRLCSRSVPSRSTLPIATRGVLCRSCLTLVQQAAQLLDDPTHE
jgi:hypothetical protein